MDLFEKLNPMQREAVKHTEGSLLILAGAGSGKTRVLTHRMAYLISLGISPFNILAITFTNKAAKEMRERANNICAEGADVWVSTFHSLCIRILRIEINKLGMDSNFTIYDSDDTLRLIKKCIKEMNISDKLYVPKSVQNQISTWKNDLLTPDNVANKSAMDFRQSVICDIYRSYQKKLKECNALDFDDIIFRAIELFINRPDVLEKYRERFKYIMVDEYQDTNTAQYTLVKLLAAKYKNICVVGDDDQSIYGWRGANIRNILDFEKDYTNTKVIKLEQNYRSTKVILESANSVISNNINRKEKALWTENEEGSLIKYNRVNSDLDEAFYIGNIIESGQAAGLKLSDYAVLYRNNAQSRVLEDQFVKRGIPYRLLGGVRFYERREIKDMLAYLKYIHNPFDELSFIRIVNVPKRGIGDTSVEKIVSYATENEITIYKALTDLELIPGLGSRTGRIAEFRDLIQKLIDFSKNNPVSDLIQLILDETGYTNELEIENTEEARGRIDNIKELRSKAAEYEKSSEDSSLTSFLEEISLVADIDNYEENENSVVLMTLHSSKGLEFKNVFITGFEEGLFPSYRSMMSGDLHDLEEERRLCYVGITRAKEKLYITSAGSRMQNGQLTYNSVSRFYREIPEECIENEARAAKKPEKPDKLRNDFTGPATGAAYTKTSLEKNNNVIPFSKTTISPGPSRLKGSTGSIPAPKGVTLEYSVGDNVRQAKYGIGTVKAIKPAGADFEITVEFSEHGVKKFMAHLAMLKKCTD